MPSRKTKILVVDDEPKMRELISLYLTKENYDVVTAEDGLKALDILEKDDCFQLVLIDVMMPRMDGFALCREINSFYDLPFIFLTARGEEYERLLGFELGADDYVVKPFSPRELVARVKAVLKRSDKRTIENLLKVNDLVVDIDGREVRLGAEEISLTPKEFDLLVYFIKNKGKVLSRDQITEKVWDHDYCGDQRTVDTHVKKLREKLGEKAEKYITTVWGVGYKFEVD
jgi:two-component system response regulator ResD